MSDFLPDVIDDEIEGEIDETDLQDEINKLQLEIVEEDKKYEEEEIFKDKPPPKVKEINDEPKPKKKRVMSEEHKQKLAKAREKALETRRKNAKVKKETKQLKEQLKDKELNDLREKVKPNKKVSIDDEPVFNNNNNKNMYTLEQVEDITTKAIMNYDNIRKDRKKKKQVVKEENKEQDKVRQQVSNLIQADPINHMFSNCY